MIARKNNFHTMGRKGIDFGEWDKDVDLFSWLDRIPKLLSKNGSVVIFNDWKNLGDIARYCESLGLEIKDLLRWEKTTPMPRNRDRRYITDYECAIWLVNKKSKWVFNRLDEKYQRPKFEYPVVSGNEKTIHTTQKPVKLMEEIIRVHTKKDNTILDCFMGSGSCGVACMNTNRKFIGIELDNNYFDIASKRIEEAYFNAQNEGVENE